MERTSPPLRLLLAADAEASGVLDLAARSEADARAGGDVGVLLLADGLALLRGEWPARWHAAGARVSLCARSARALRIDPLGVPPTVLWSSVATFFATAPEGALVWSAFP